MTRQSKTPTQRAEEALAVANRKVIRLDKEVDALNLAVATKRREQTEAIALRDFLAQHPALPRATTPPTSTTSITTGTTTSTKEGTTR